MYNSLNATYGPQSQTSFQFGTLSQKEANLNVDFTYPVNVGFFSPLTLAWGAEYRKETYGQTAGDVQSYGGGPLRQSAAALHADDAGRLRAVPYTRRVPSFSARQPVALLHRSQGPGASGYGGTSPTYAGSWSQWSWGVYGDAEADITQQLSVGVAGRYEHYNTFGGSFVYKVNAHLQDHAADLDPRNGRHRLPRAVAWPVARRDPDHQLRRGQPGADRHLSGRQPDLAIFRRDDAQARKVA